MTLKQTQKGRGDITYYRRYLNGLFGGVPHIDRSEIVQAVKVKGRSWYAKIKRVKRKEIKTKCHDFCEGETEEAYLRLIKRKYSAVNIKSKLKVKHVDVKERRWSNTPFPYSEYGKSGRDNYDLFYVMYDKDEQTTESIENAVRCAQRHRPEIKTIFQMNALNSGYYFTLRKSIDT